MYYIHSNIKHEKLQPIVTKGQMDSSDQLHYIFIPLYKNFKRIFVNFSFKKTNHIVV